MKKLILSAFLLAFAPAFAQNVEQTSEFVTREYVVTPETVLISSKALPNPSNVVYRVKFTWLHSAAGRIDTTVAKNATWEIVREVHIAGAVPTQYTDGKWNSSRRVELREHDVKNQIKDILAGVSAVKVRNEEIFLVPTPQPVVTTPVIPAVPESPNVLPDER